MITHIKTKNFMGADIDEDISQKMIYTGENTAGKTKRSKAIILTLLGFIPSPGKTIKIASDILNTLGNGQEMSTAVTCGGDIFERSFKRSKKGTVSQKFRRNGKSRSKSAFIVELVKAGDPRVVDLDQFLSLSENGKIDALFDLYPPDGDLSTLDSDIERSKKEISRLNEEKGESDNVITALIKSKNDIELPAGSLAETQESIKELTEKVVESQENLKKLEIEEAKVETAEETKRNVKKEREETQANLNKTMEDNTKPWTPPDVVGSLESDYADEVCNNHRNSNQNSYVSNKEIGDFASGRPGPFDAHESIKRIIDTMKKSGCQVCAALIVARFELKKYK